MSDMVLSDGIVKNAFIHEPITAKVFFRKLCVVGSLRGLLNTTFMQIIGNSVFF